jgi:hypothetical protein
MPNIVSTLLRASFKYLLHPIGVRESSGRSQGSGRRPFGFDTQTSSKASITASGFLLTIMKSRPSACKRTRSEIRLPTNDTKHRCLISLVRTSGFGRICEVRMPAFGTRAKTVECFHNNHDQLMFRILDLRERHTFVGEGVYIRVADVSTKLP